MKAAMDAERQAFVEEIAAHPDDDAPRLVYADWLEERGDPQGQFIRVQCELARTSADSPHGRELHDQQCELLATYRDEWVRAVSPAIRWSTFRRGLLEAAIIDGSALVEQGGHPLARAPILELGSCLESPQQVAGLAACKEFTRLRKLRLGGSPLGDDGIRRLVESPCFPPVRVLWLTRCNIGPGGVQALAECRALGGLERLILTGNPLGDEGARILAAAQTFANLRLLAVEDCEFAEAGVEALGNSAVLKQAVRLPRVRTRQPDVGIDEESSPVDPSVVRSIADVVHMSRELTRMMPISETAETPAAAGQPRSEPPRRLTVAEILERARGDIERRMPK
jgi:uncharacterized protein (TIGR02996 family)